MNLSNHDDQIKHNAKIGLQTAITAAIKHAAALRDDVLADRLLALKRDAIASGHHPARSSVQ
jgi:hypothetical protein